MYLELYLRVQKSACYLDGRYKEAGCPLSSADSLCIISSTVVATETSRKIFNRKCFDVHPSHSCC